jgi:complement component 1 Q subcomponent-binding protein, mitochondrial
VYSIADFNNESQYPQEDPYEDEEMEEGEASSEQPLQTAPEDSVESPEYNEPYFSVKLSIQVTKADKPGAILMEAVAENGRIILEDFWFLKDAGTLSPKTFDLEKKRLDQYAGPNFANLDEDLQGLMENYIADRGVNEELASFVVDYVDWKERKEYLQWLESELP